MEKELILRIAFVFDNIVIKHALFFGIIRIFIGNRLFCTVNDFILMLDGMFSIKNLCLTIEFKHYIFQVFRLE